MAAVYRCKVPMSRPARAYGLVARFLAACATLVIGACAPSDRRPTDALVRGTSAEIHHIVIAIQENRSFDNLFYGFPHADTAKTGRLRNGTRVALRPISLTAPFDLSHGYQDFLRDYDGGRMDGFAANQPSTKGMRSVAKGGSGPHPQYAYVPHSEIAPYFSLASQYVLADHMFQSNLDQSFAAHL